MKVRFIATALALLLAPVASEAAAKVRDGLDIKCDCLKMSDGSKCPDDLGMEVHGKKGSMETPSIITDMDFVYKKRSGIPYVVGTVGKDFEGPSYYAILYFPHKLSRVEMSSDINVNRPLTFKPGRPSTAFLTCKAVPPSK
jgi:hypothetical protein